MFALARRAATVALFAIASPAFATDALPIANPGFESGLAGWTPSAADLERGIAQVTPEAARGGQAGLRIRQQAGDPGSWLRSPAVAVEAGEYYRLEFQARLVEQDGIGVWLQFLDAAKQPVPTPSDIAVQVPAGATDWTPCRLEIAAPAGSAWLTLAVHGYNKRAVTADFDDFSVTPIAAPSAPTTPVVANPLMPDPARVDAIAALLPPLPRGPGPALEDRAAWDRLGQGSDFREKTVARAIRFRDREPTPVITPEMWEAALKSRDRKIDSLVDRRRFRLVTLVLAEGIENQGGFLPAIEAEIGTICAESTWILSGHVAYTYGRNDLGTAMTAWNLAAADTLLGDRLAPATRALIRERVKDRVLRHYLAVLRGEKKPEWWSTDAQNWNAVVHAGVVGSALALLDSPRERAEIVAGAERGIKFYLRGFPADGYSPEGSGYWKYGFGHYLLMAESVSRATGGKVNLYDADCALLAQFPRRFAIAPDVYPAYGDNPLLDSTSHWMAFLIDCRFALGDGAGRPSVLDPMYSAFLYAYAVNLAFDPAAMAPVGAKAPILRGHRLRDWFELSQVYVGRLPAGRQGLGVSFRGGNNATPHGHHDLGTFVAVVGGKPVLADPGVVVYDAQTFGPNRFEHPVMNSLGHPVPLVASARQKDGATALTTVLEQKFADERDVVALDLTKAYEVPALRSLVRRFTYDRAGDGSLTVEDKIVFDRPESFASALITYGEAREESPGLWLLSYEGQSVRVTISASGGNRVSVRDGFLEKQSKAGAVRRLAIEVAEPVSEATLTITVAPATAAP